MTRHENHDAFARRAAANRTPDPDANTPVFACQKMMVTVGIGTVLVWAGAIVWAMQ